MNSYGKNEAKGPTLTAAQLFGAAPARPACEVCGNGHLSSEAVGRKLGRCLGDSPYLCPACKRVLSGEYA